MESISEIYHPFGSKHWLCYWDRLISWLYRNTTYIIVSWHNVKQLIRMHTSDLIVLLRWSTSIVLYHMSFLPPSLTVTSHERHGVPNSRHIDYLFNSLLRLTTKETPGGGVNIKMSSYQYRKSHCGDKTSYLHNGISYTGKMTSLYWIRAQRSVLPTPSEGNPPVNVIL